MAQRLTPTVKCEICYERYKALASHLKKHGYNSKRYAKEFEGAPLVSPMTRRKMQLARLKYILKKRGKIKNAPKNLARSLAQLGKKKSPETREKIRQARLGKTLSMSHRMAISASLMGHEVSPETRLKLSQVEFSPEHRRKLSQVQSAEKGNAWKGGRSRYLYMSKGKYRLKRIFGEPLKCFYPGCDKVEGFNVKSVDCHHIDGDHENNPLDGMNWLPLCRKHHMLADGRLPGSTEDQVARAQKLAAKAHSDYMQENYVGEIKTYYD